MPIPNDRYIKLQHEDFIVIEKIFSEIAIDSMRPEELIVFGRVQKIIQLMEEKWRKENNSNSTVETIPT